MADVASEAQAKDQTKEKKKRKSGVKKGSESSPAKNSSGRKSSSGTANDSNVEEEVVETQVAQTEQGESNEVDEADRICETTVANGVEKQPETEVKPQATAVQSHQNEQQTIPAAPKEMYKAPPAATKKDISLLSDIDEKKLLELKEAFLLFDLNNDGIIDRNDLILTYQTLGQNNIPEEDIQKMLSEAPNPLDFDAFVVLLGYKTIELDPEETLLEALSQWDYNNSGLISEERIRHDLMTWGDRFTAKEVDVALEDAPVYINKGKAMIDYVKFCKALCGLRKKPKVSPSGEL